MCGIAVSTRCSGADGSAALGFDPEDYPKLCEINAGRGGILPLFKLVLAQSMQVPTRRKLFHESYQRLVLRQVNYRYAVRLRCCISEETMLPLSHTPISMVTYSAGMERCDSELCSFL